MTGTLLTALTALADGEGHTGEGWSQEGGSKALGEPLAYGPLLGLLSTASALWLVCFQVLFPITIS